MHLERMLSTHPDVRGNVNEALIRCIAACTGCAETCAICADACLAEEGVQDLRQCIRLNWDCADVCLATARVASRRTGSDEAVLRRLIEVCAEACHHCGEECHRHASQMDHCRLCAEDCARCERACRNAASSVTRTLQ